MTTYPTGCIQNHASAGPPDWKPVDPDMWRTFGTLDDATAGLGMIAGILDQAQMFPAEMMGGIYAAFRYLPAAADAGEIHSRVCVGEGRDAEGAFYILEYPSDIFDRDTVPKTMIDSYTAGQPHTLKARRVTPTLCELYWAAA